MERSIVSIVFRIWGAVVEAFQIERRLQRKRRLMRKPVGAPSPSTSHGLKFYLYFILAQPEANDIELARLAARLCQIERASSVAISPVGPI